MLWAALEKNDLRSSNTWRSVSFVRHSCPRALARAGISEWTRIAMVCEYRRAQEREKLVLTALLRLGSREQRVRMRNLSGDGAMIEGAIDISKGAAVSLYVGKIGWVDGVVAWVLEDRSGIAFTG